MDINNSSINNQTNISSITASRISKLNLNTANRAFEQAKKELDNNNSIQEETETKKEDIKLIEKAPKVDVEDIKKYANYMGENLSIDDINYGLMYGRSVIADYSA